jgi:hypothetical protein
MLADEGLAWAAMRTAETIDVGVGHDAKQPSRGWFPTKVLNAA